MRRRLVLQHHLYFYVYIVSFLLISYTVLASSVSHSVWTWQWKTLMNLRPCYYLNQVAVINFPRSFNYNSLSRPLSPSVLPPPAGTATWQGPPSFSRGEARLRRTGDKWSILWNINWFLWENIWCFYFCKKSQSVSIGQCFENLDIISLLLGPVGDTPERWGHLRVATAVVSILNLSL